MAAGPIERCKAWLVAKRYNQEYGVDYKETFAPVPKMTIVRTLLVVSAIMSWCPSQMDVKNSFLNGFISEEIYMKPPPSLRHPFGHACRLRWALYGLKQAPRALVYQVL